MDPCRRPAAAESTVEAAWPQANAPSNHGPEKLMELKSKVVLYVAKTRFGPTGKVQLSWVANRAMFGIAAPTYRHHVPQHSQN